MNAEQMIAAAKSVVPRSFDEVEIESEDGRYWIYCPLIGEPVITKMAEVERS